MTEPRVLILEDDVELGGLLERGLREEGFAPALATTGADALDRVAAQPPDALIIDIGLPDADGRDVCQALRARGIAAPVLFLTARDALSDRLAGFGAGGDDYLTKPFAVEELIARLRALVRRAGHDTAIEMGPFRLDPTTHAIHCGGVTESLTPTEFRLLAALIRHPGQTLTPDQLLKLAWNDPLGVGPDRVKFGVMRLRRKLGQNAGEPGAAIEAVRGFGYRYVPPA